MQEEFHGAGWNDGNGPFKLLYGWGTLNANIWLPSLSELVGYDVTQSWATNGCYYSAMQGLNTSTNYHTDAQGGVQFTYFKQFNASGGGEKIWSACKQEITWLRSPVYAYTDRANSFSSIDGVWHVPSLLQPLAVHPAVLSEQAPYLIDASSIFLVFLENVHFITRF